MNRSMENYQYKKRINQHVFTKNREWHDAGNDSGSEDENSDSKVSSSSVNIEAAAIVYQPSFADILVLLTNSNRSKTFRLPLQILVEIFAYADYYPETKKIRDQIVPGGRDQNDLHLSLPVMRMKYFDVHEIVYTVESKDQGWSSSPENQKGTRFGSYTWAEAALSTDPTVRYEMCVNIHAGTSYERQSKTYGVGSDLYQALVEHLAAVSGGEENHPCELQLWIRSLYPGWANHVKYGAIKVRWRLGNWQDFIASTVR